MEKTLMWSRTQAAVDKLRPPTVQPFVYQPVLDAMGHERRRDADNDDDTSPLAASPPEQAAPTPPPPPIIGFTDDQVRVKEDQARALGFKEGEAQARGRFEKALAAEREAIAKAVHDLAREREVYFCRVEAEVVKLAVGIARKILHREVQVDPLLLAGVVRVALEKLTAGTSIRLRVHPDHVYAWHDFFANQQDHRPVPELLGDASLGMGHCVLETTLGSTELTLEAQLAEIERGFFDLLAQRPGAS
jgi:flagellar assembly protein FliH